MGTVHPSYVSWVFDNHVEVICFERHLTPQLKGLGGKRRLLQRHRWAIRHAGERSLADTLAALRDTGLALVGGPAGWPPGAIFEHLREKGLVRGGYREIVWSGPGQPIITER